MPLCQPSFGSRARFVQRATWTAACFQASHQQRMKAFKRGESCIFFLSQPGSFVSHKVSACLPAVSSLLVLPGMRAFCCEQMRHVLVFKFGGTASQLVISGGRHGVHLAK